MTHSSDPSGSSARSSREPPTIDLTARVVDEGAREATQDGAHAEESRAEASPASEAERADAAQDAMLEGGPADDPGAPEAPGHAAVAPELARRGPGLAPLAGAGLLGGLVGAGAILAFQAWRPAAAPSDPRVAALEQRIAALPRTDTAAIERRLSALEGAQTGLAQRVQAAQEGAERAAARADEAFNRPVPAAPSVPASPPPATDGAVPELGSRIDALETRLREQADAAAGERQAIRQSVEGAAGTVQALERRLAEQEQRLAAVARQMEDAGGAAARASNRLVLASRLDAALRDGMPYREVLEGLSRAGADQARISALEPFAEQGAPTAAALAQSFKPLAERIAAASRPAPSPATPASAPPASAPSETWTDRVVGLLGKVVTIRRADAPRASQGTAAQPTGATTAPIEQALARGDLAAAAAAWDALPEPARQASADWGQQLKHRAAAEAASHALAADAVTALNSMTR